MFAAGMSVWIVSRLMFITSCWFQGTYKLLPFKEVAFKDGERYAYMWTGTKFAGRMVIFLIYTICVLNYYWFSMACKILYNKLFVHGEYVVDIEGDVAKAEQGKKNK